MFETRPEHIKPPKLGVDSDSRPFFKDEVRVKLHTEKEYIVSTVTWTLTGGKWLALVDSDVPIYGTDNSFIPNGSSRYIAQAIAFLREVSLESKIDYAMGMHWDISTAHITENDAKMLTDADPDNFPLALYSRRGYGWFIPILLTDEEFDPMMAELEANWNFSEAFKDLLTIAHKARVNYIVLDCDGMDWPEILFPRFEW